MRSTRSSGAMRCVSGDMGVWGVMGVLGFLKDASVNDEAGLALARGGVLTRLVRWMEDHCALPHPQVGRLPLPLPSAPQLPTCRRPATGVFLLFLGVGHSLRAARVVAVQDSLNDLGGMVWALVSTAVSALKHEEIDKTEDGSSLRSPALWQRVRVEVLEPLALELEAKAAAEEGDAARQAQLAVDVAQALAMRRCAHPCCTTIVGAREADAPHGKLCSGCRGVRYCGPACQKADWPAHKAACRELARRKAG